MFILHTSILAAIMRPKPAPRVAAWIARQNPDVLFTTALCQAEILANLPAGRKRQSLQDAAHAMFAEDFQGRVLPFDTAAATAYADLAAIQAATLDRMTAAIARAHRATIVTHDARAFDGCGVTVINPSAPS